MEPDGIIEVSDFCNFLQKKPYIYLEAYGGYSMSVLYIYSRVTGTRSPTTSMRWTCERTCFAVFTHMVLRSRQLFSNVLSFLAFEVCVFYDLHIMVMGYFFLLLHKILIQIFSQLNGLVDAWRYMIPFQSFKLGANNKHAFILH